MAVEAVTERIVHTAGLSEDVNTPIDTNHNKLNDLLTDQCYKRLIDCYPKILAAKDQIDLVNIPKEDVFYAWIEQLQDDSDGTILMKVCTLSFPNYGLMVRKVKENYERQKALKEELKQAPNLDKETLKKTFGDDDKLMYNPMNNVKSNEIVVSNFTFKRGPENEDPWLINDVSLQTGSKSFSKIGEFRWRGRMLLSLRGRSFDKILRFDYASDYFILLMLLFISVIAVVIPF